MLYISKSAVVINIIIAFLVPRFSGDQTLDGKPSQESRVRALNANNSVLGHITAETRLWAAKKLSE